MHLFVILTDACNNSMHLLVPICTIREKRFYDPACIIPANSHPFIKVNSYVHYTEIQSRHQAHISKCVDEKNYVEKEILDDAIFEAVCRGLKTSEHMPLWAERQYINWPN